MNQEFTKTVQDWLNTPAEQRDYAKGALLLLQLTGNQIMYRNLMANPKRNAPFIERQLQKLLNFRLQQLTPRTSRGNAAAGRCHRQKSFDPQQR